jgi:hypothetical protein
MMAGYGAALEVGRWIEMARRVLTGELRRPRGARVWLPVERTAALARASFVVWRCRVLAGRVGTEEERERARSWLRTLELQREYLRLSYCDPLAPEHRARRAEISRELAALAIARLDAEPPGPLRDYRIAAARLETEARDRLDRLTAEIREVAGAPAALREHRRGIEAGLREKGLLPGAEELAALEREQE